RVPRGADAGEVLLRDHAARLARRAHHRLRHAALRTDARGGPGAGLRSHPFTAPRVSPLAILRSKRRTRTTSGSVAITTAAESCPHGTSKSDDPPTLAIPAVTVFAAS